MEEIDFRQILKELAGGNEFDKEFIAERHKEEHPHYLEVILDKDGKVFYATPSHQEKMVDIAVQKLKITVDELWDMIPQEYYADVLTWLNIQTGAIPVWTKFYLCEPNEAQKKTLRYLKDMGIYEGDIR